MYVCICNQITEQDLMDNPDNVNLVGTRCGCCLDSLPDMVDNLSKELGEKKD